MLEILDLPNRRQKEVLDNYVPGTGPDPHIRMTMMAAHGVHWRFRDLHRFPLNPLAGRGTFYAGLDPIRALSVLLFERRIDLICCGYESGILLVLLLRRLFFYRTKIVMFDVCARGWRIRDWALDFVMPRLDGVLTLTDHQRIEADRTYRLKRPAEAVGFAVDGDFFTPEPDDGSPDDGSIFAIGEDVGRDYPTLLAACRDLDHPLLIRAAPANVPTLQPGTTLLARMSATEIRAHYARARIVVIPQHPSTNPTGVTSILEAMAMAKPVIASDIGTTRDVIIHEVNGLIVPPGDTAALRQAITRLMHNPELRHRLGQAARAAIDGPLSYDRHTARFAAALRRIAAE